jgi:hypothetical protein
MLKYKSLRNKSEFNPLIITAGQLAAMAGVSRVTVWKEARAGSIRGAIKPKTARGHWRFPEEAGKWYADLKRQTYVPKQKANPKRHWRSIPQSERNKNSGFITISAVRALYLQWRRKNYKGLLEGDLKMQEEVLAELEPICELIDKLRARVGVTKPRLDPEAPISLEAVGE